MARYLSFSTFDVTCTLSVTLHMCAPELACATREKGGFYPVFADIVYASCWLKCHEPAAFACALLNSQPMGFYAPSQIVQDARRHDIDVFPIDVQCSEWDRRPPAFSSSRL